MVSRSGLLGALLAAIVATGAAVVAGVVLRSPAPAPTTPPLATTLASVDTATVAVRRGAFCAAVPVADARKAVDDASPTLSSWSNGDQLGAGPEVAHEFGCSWTGGSGTVASGWVFAPPVTVERAQELVTAARSAKGCAPLPGAAAYGSPSVALTCTAGGVTTLSYQGLFGDAWLVCRLAGSHAADPADVADRWCASVLLAAR